MPDGLEKEWGKLTNRAEREVNALVNSTRAFRKELPETTAGLTSMKKSAESVADLRNGVTVTQAPPEKAGAPTIMIGRRAIVDGIARSGAGTLVVNTLSQGASTFVGSAMGNSAGMVAGTMASDMGTGALAAVIAGGMGTAAAGGAGAAAAGGLAVAGVAMSGGLLLAAGVMIGAIVGIFDSIIKLYKEKDEAFRNYVSEQFDSIQQTGEERLQRGTELAMAQDEGYMTALAIRQESQDQMDGAMGRGYLTARKVGAARYNDRYEGTEENRAIQDMNRIIGAGRGYQENLQEKYQQEALAALTTGAGTTVYGEVQASRLAEMNQEYKDLAGQFAAADEDNKAGLAARIEALKGEAEGMAESAFNASVGMQEVRDSQLELVAALRKNTDALGNYAWDREYRLANEKSKGLLSVGSSVDAGASTHTTNSETFARRSRGVYTYVPDEDGSHAAGLQRVPYDGYRALLHEGERVQTAAEVRAGAAGGSGVNVTISGNEFTVRSDADVDAIARAMVEEIVLRRKAGVL